MEDNSVKFNITMEASLSPENISGSIEASPENNFGELLADVPSVYKPLHGVLGATTLQGDSAYQVAVNNGFEGTEAEWLESIRGYTPVRGLDYWTEEDKQEIRQDIDDQLALAHGFAAQSELFADMSQEFAEIAQQAAEDAQNHPINVTVTGDGDLITDMSVDGHDITAVKGKKFEYQFLDGLPTINGQKIIGSYEVGGGLAIENRVIKLADERTVTFRIASTAQWVVEPTYTPDAGQVIIYNDHYVIDGQKYIGMKVGDGITPVIDLPFLGDEHLVLLDDHINNSVVHVTQAEREYWNAKTKINGVIDGNLIFGF